MRKVFLLALAVLFGAALFAEGSIWDVPSVRISVATNTRTVFAPASSNMLEVMTWLDTHWMEYSNYVDAYYASIRAGTSNDVAVLSNQLHAADLALQTNIDIVQSNLNYAVSNVGPTIATWITGVNHDYSDGTTNTFDDIVASGISLGGTVVTSWPDVSREIVYIHGINTNSTLSPSVGVTLTGAVDVASSTVMSNAWQSGQQFVAPVSGLYRIDAMACLNNGIDANHYGYIAMYKGGELISPTAPADFGYSINGAQRTYRDSRVIDLIAAEVVTIKVLGKSNNMKTVSWSAIFERVSTSHVP